MKYLFVVIMLCGWLQVADGDESGSIALHGTWVDVYTKTDTLTFKRVGDSDYMILGRGTVNNFGSPRVKGGSGPYHYKLLGGDLISLHWSLSSDSHYKDYFFKQAGDTIVIGNFFDVSNNQTRLTFQKIE